MKFKMNLVLTILLSMLGTLAITSCGDSVVGVGDTLNSSSSVSLSDLAEPTAVKIVVISDTTANVVVTAANNEDNFVGYYLVSSTGTVLDSIGIGAPFIGDTSFAIAINRDVAASYSVVSFDDDGNHSSNVVAAFVPRMANGPYNVTEIHAKVEGGEGVAIFADSVSVASVADSIATKSYLGGGNASVFFESTANGGVTLTPINGGKVVALASNSALLTQTQIDKIATLTISVDLADGYNVLADGTAVYTNGKSVRATDPTDSPVEIAAGQSYFVMNATGDYARLNITAIASGVVTATVFSPSTNEGAPLFKK